MPAVDPFNGYQKTLASLPDRWKAVTPHATNYIDGNADEHGVAVALRVVGGGVLEFIDRYGLTTTMTLMDFEIIPCSAVRVLAGNTTATGIHAGFIGGPVG